MTYPAIAAAVLVGSLTALSPALGDSVPACQAFEAKLRVEARHVLKGHRPAFTLTLRNTAPIPLRLLDTRGGRRRDLADTYYKLVIRTKRGVEPDIPRVISDPGPISDEDYFALHTGEAAQIGITSPLTLEALRTGQYVAHVVIWVDPLQLGSRCRSSYADFVVQ